MIKLSRPADYDPRQGAFFNFEFTKAKNLTGDDAQSLELALSGDEKGSMWTWKTAEAGTYERVVSLSNAGLNQTDIAAELGINKSNVSRHQKRAKAEGRLKESPK